MGSLPEAGAESREGGGSNGQLVVKLVGWPQWGTGCEVGRVGPLPYHPHQQIWGGLSQSSLSPDFQ